jgi:hypothetical protein
LSKTVRHIYSQGRKIGLNSKYKDKWELIVKGQGRSKRMENYLEETLGVSEDPE